MGQTGRDCNAIRPTGDSNQSQAPCGCDRVLVVDDSTTLLKLMAHALKRFDVEVTTINNGIDAIALAKTAEAEGRAFDVIFMDVVMPELTGTDATHRLRKLGYRGHIVIFTAADDKEYDMATSLCAGADDFLPKPFTPDQLHAVMERVCHCSEAQDPPRPTAGDGSSPGPVNAPRTNCGSDQRDVA